MLFHCYKTRSMSRLLSTLATLEEHFAHDEDLMKSHRIGNSDQDAKAGNGFSPFDSRVKDHARILEIGYDELARVSSYSENCADSSS
mmetsp:Transcript_2407/g.4209  ORF Transcript_2407/g.4209 Transcript_2407/m.4209 type:complete len:87 (+) Transcript_2407:1052-1312(+)